ncbi:MAG: hypothetical protein RRY12_12335 [Cloacibacillus sp.]
MRFLLLLLLGTLIFGFAFPAMLLMMALIGFLLFALIIYKFLRGSSSFTVYTNRDFRREPGADGERREVSGGRRTVYTEDDPEVVASSRRRDPSVENTATDEDEMEESCEIVELPATALRKDDGAKEAEAKNDNA